MELTQAQKLKRLKKVSEYAEKQGVAIVESLVELDEKIEDAIEKLSLAHNGDTKAVLEGIKGIVIPVPKDHTEHLSKMEEKMEEPLNIKVTLKIV